MSIACPVVVYAIILDADGRVLLGQRANTGFGDGCWSLPSGHLNGGEQLAEAVCRECAEELGITVAPADARFVGLAHRPAVEVGQERIDVFFAIERYEGEIHNAEPHKCQQLRYFASDALPTDTLPYVAAALQQGDADGWLLSHGWDRPEQDS